MKSLPNKHPKKVFFIFSALLTSLMFSFCCYLLNLPIIFPGPEFAITETTKSLYYTGSYHAKYFDQVYAEATAYSKNTSSDVYQDVFALDQDGKLSPKHSLFSSFAALPFYLIFGELGFWIMQQAFLMWLVCSTYIIAKELCGYEAPWSTLLATLFLSQTLFYSYDFSYELHGAALIIGGLSIGKRRPFLGSFVATLSCFVRPTNILIAVPLCFAWGIREKKLRHCAISCLGALLPILAFMYFNYLLRGNIFITTYERLPYFLNGNAYIANHPIGFELKELFSNWREKIWSSKGLLPYNLSFLALPYVIYRVIKHPQVLFLSYCLAISLAYTLYFFSYQMWHATFEGNRFLLPAIYIYLIAFIVAFSPHFETGKAK